jgi:parallel beta helix pectate lyase-like protein
VPRVHEPLAQTFPSHYDDDPLIIENQTFVAMAPGQTAIRLEWPASPSIAQSGAIIRNCTFKPGIYGWTNAIHLVNGWNVVIENCNGYAGPDGSFQNGIILDGQSMDAKIARCHFVHCVTGIQITGESEGATIHDCRVLGGIFGVFANTPLAEAGLTVSDSHFAVSRAGIVAVNRPQASFHDLLIYRHEWRGAEWFDGIYLGPGSHDSDVHDVKVKTFGYPGAPLSVWQASNLNVRDVRSLD